MIEIDITKKPVSEKEINDEIVRLKSIYERQQRFLSQASRIFAVLMVVCLIAWFASDLYTYSNKTHTMAHAIKVALIAVGMLVILSFLKYAAYWLYYRREALIDPDKFERLKQVDKTDSAQIIEWCNDPVVDQYRLDVVAMGRSLIKAEAKVMRDYYLRAEEERAKADQESQAEAAFSKLYSPAPLASK